MAEAYARTAATALRQNDGARLRALLAHDDAHVTALAAANVASLDAVCGRFLDGGASQAFLIQPFFF